MLKKENKKRRLITFGVILCILGIYLLSNNYLKEKVDKAYNVMNLQLLAYNEYSVPELDNESNEEQEETEINEQDNNQNSNNQNNNKIDEYENYYIAKLRIPDINLEQGFVDVNSPYNDVNKNIQVIKGSNYPDVENGNLILASHAGTNAVSYFRNLYKLSKGDKCYVTYNGKTYTYNIVNIYKKPKVGQIAIYRDYNKTTLTLITCTRGSNNLQTVYIAELENIE